MMNHRVVITGTGIWSCIGKNKEEVELSLRQGQSGIGIDPSRRDYGYQSPLTGIVPSPDLKGQLNRRLRMSLSQEAAYAYMATEEAFLQSGIDSDFLEHHEMGIIFGNDSSAKPVVETANIMAERHDSALLGSGLIFQSMNSTVNMNLSAIYHLSGVNLSISAACASGSHAIGLGYLLIKQGLQKRVLCGGAQEVNLYAMATFDALGTFSKRFSHPKQASRPFDRDRDGLVPSGGAAALVLEDYECAMKRGAPILAEVCGYGFSSNGIGISQPSADGSIKAMQRAMDEANLSTHDIDYINAHATSTPQGDMLEAIALNQLFSETHALISSTKSMTGHECWMAGASELVYSTLMLNGNFVAPNINLENRDEYTASLNLATETIDVEIHTILSNSFGFGGTNSALIIKKIN